MLDLFYQARWGELYAFFAEGEPPLALELLIVNTMFFVVFIMRRARGARTVRSETAVAMQGFLIFANTVVLFQDYLWQYKNRLLDAIPPIF
ncbi:MAG: hypothetical protein ACT4SY_10105 [Hyphomicrobiales bacterium]